MQLKNLIERLQKKIQGTNSEKKKFKIKTDLSELESIKEKQEENYSLLKQHIKTFTNGKVITPSENNTKLSTEIIKSTGWGYLSKEFQNESINSLLFKNKDFESIEDQMMKESKNKKEMK